MGSCCTPPRPPGEPGPGRPTTGSTPAGGGRAGPLVIVPGGAVLLGSDDPGFPEEWPVRRVEVAPFAIGAHAVSNDEFAAFVAATGHRSTAEGYGWSFVFAGLLPDDHPPTRGVAAAPWWRQVEGADWSHPEGPRSDVEGRGRHPVVHVSRDDAEAYATWCGTRLPTEDEWECAARGGLEQAVFPWGDDLEPGGEHRMNVWQGEFPAHDTAADGWAGTCPVDAFPPNALGLHNTTGNVWEWCAGRWSDLDPSGVSRGGSYLCHASYCRRYRVAARQAHERESTTGNLGFRVAADAPTG